MNILRTAVVDDGVSQSESVSDEHVTTISHRAMVGTELSGLRADQAVAKLFPDYSRARLSEWIKTGELRVDGRQVRPKDHLRGGECIELEATITKVGDALAEAISLDVLYEDADLLILNKPVGLVVHPGAGNPTGTLVNALLHLDPTLASLPRAGIVHRLDKDTSGCLLVARTVRAHTALVAMLSERLIHRQYEAVVQGEPVAGGRVDAPIGRHPVDRLRMAVTEEGRPAATQFRVRERFRGFTSLQVNLESGRTHQIRVHMAHLRLNLLGDQLYGASLRLPRGASADVIEKLRGFRRQALHAEKLQFTHPFSGDMVEANAPRPADLQDVLVALRAASVTASQ
ncbi:MAG: 23S rRNA pseudouridine(1911/1915/1917) synthase RluD [Pseudomarimonas sp.]